MDCIFCKIVKGESPSYTIYEDDVVKVFLNIAPKSNGHALVIPKQHFENMYDIDIEVQKHIEDVCKKVGNLLKEKLHCTGVTRIQNNEHGQEIKHYHMHLIPRYDNDKLDFSLNLENEMLEPEEVFKKF